MQEHSGVRCDEALASDHAQESSRTRSKAVDIRVDWSWTGCDEVGGVKSGQELAARALDMQVDRFGRFGSEPIE